MYLLKKNLLLAALALAPAIKTHAQLFLSGNVSYTGIQNTSKGAAGDELSSSGSRSFTVAPRIGLFIGEKWVVGLETGYHWDQSKTSSVGSHYSQNLFMPGVFGRYFVKTWDRVSLFGDAEFVYGFGKQSLYGSSGKQNVTQLTGSIRPGISFGITPKMNFEATFGALQLLDMTTKFDNGSRNTTTNFIVNFNSFRFGVWFRI